MYEQGSLLSRLLDSYSEEGLDTDGIEGKRVAERLAEMEKVGWTDEGGPKRLGFSQEER